MHCYAECHYAECRYAECGYAECRGALLTLYTTTTGTRENLDPSNFYSEAYSALTIWLVLLANIFIHIFVREVIIQTCWGDESYE